MKKPDDEIIEGILRGEEHGYAILLQRYRAKVYSLALRILRRPEDAEEAAQDAFIRAFHALDSFEGRARFSTWLYRITYNTSLNHAKRLKPMNVVQDLEDEERIEDDAASADLHLEHEELRAVVVSVLAEMKPEYASLLSLFYLQDQGYDDIVTITGLPLGTVKNRLHRARVILRKAVLKEYSYEGSTST